MKVSAFKAKILPDKSGLTRGVVPYGEMSALRLRNEIFECANPSVSEIWGRA